MLGHGLHCVRWPDAEVESARAASSARLLLYQTTSATASRKNVGKTTESRRKGYRSDVMVAQSVFIPVPEFHPRSDGCHAMKPRGKNPWQRR